MNTSPRPRSVSVRDASLWVELDDGRTLGVPLAWFPRLLNASTEQLANVELSARGMHWEELDEDVSVEGLLAGHGDLGRHRDKAA